MSGSINLTPAPVQLPSMAVGDDDARWVDFSPELNPLGDLIQNVIGITFSHADGTPSMAGDVTLDPSTGRVPTISNAGQRVTVWMIAGQNPFLFAVDIQVFTQQGRTLNRTVYLQIAAALG